MVYVYPLPLLVISVLERLQGDYDLRSLLVLGGVFCLVGFF